MTIQQWPHEWVQMTRRYLRVSAGVPLRALASDRLRRAEQRRGREWTRPRARLREAEARRADGRAPQWPRFGAWWRAQSRVPAVAGWSSPDVNSSVRAACAAARNVLHLV